MNIYFGPIGSDAGGIYIGADGKIHRIPGWNPEAMLDLSRSLRVLGQAALIKQAGLSDKVIDSVHGFAMKELETHVKGGGVFVI